MPKVKPGGSVSPGVRRYGTKSRYTTEELERILSDIKCGKISQREASKLYNIPRNTLRNKLLGQHNKKVGRPTIFSKEEELFFIQHILYLSDEGIPISLFDVRCVVKCYLDTQNRKVQQFKGNMPGWDWSQSFLERHKAALKQRLETNISRRRAQVNEETLNEFFNNFEGEVSEVSACNIYNYDETGFHDNPSRRKLLFRRSCRHPERIRNSTKSCYTVVFCGSADGNFIPPYVIMKGTQKWSDWVYGAPEGTRLNTSKSGWIDNKVFDDWFEYHFLPIAKTKPGKIILIGDNMSAHLSIYTLKLAAENDVRLLFFPPNSTHLLQPLDVAYFSSLKTYWRQVLSSWRETKGGKKVVALPKAVFCQLLKATLEKGQETGCNNLRKGFECSGLNPVNRDKVLQKLPMYARTTDEVREDVGNEFRKYIESVRTNDLSAVHRARKFCLPVRAGKSVSVEEVEAYYANKETEEKQKMTSKGRGGARTRGGRLKSSSVRTQGGRLQSRNDLFIRNFRRKSI
ncbi:uncharacterized protein LOC134544837 [Bacillus rossius redtenbacheri]|uniref:uncharacterized protein LOC134544837 n=1 Tax=Bacillus rossius redtenbacheri TaxID=93214 RepID=UPI002FDE8B7D